MNADYSGQPIILSAGRIPEIEMIVQRWSQLPFTIMDEGVRKEFEEFMQSDEIIQSKLAERSSGFSDTELRESMVAMAETKLSTYSTPTPKHHNKKHQSKTGKKKRSKQQKQSRLKNR